MFSVIDRDDLSVIVVGAGNVPYMKRAIEKIEAALSNLQDPGTEDVREATELVLLEFFNQRIYPRPDYWQAAFELIIGLWTRRDGHTILSTSEVNVTKAVLSAPSGSCCVGLGRHVSEYALGLTFQFGLSVEHGKFVAAFCVKAAKDYVDSCGGQTHVSTISQDGKIKRVLLAEILEAENYTTDLYQTLGLLLTVLDVGDSSLQDEFGDLSMSDIIESISNSVREFRKKRREYREKIKRVRAAAQKRPTQLQPQGK
jgi:hypothetical protein